MRYLTGIQSSGTPHLGNLLGAIEPAIRLAAAQPEPAFYFIADLHTLTSSRNAELNARYTWEVAAAWLATGLDPAKTVFYRQSDVPEVTELAWYLACFTPYAMLANAHSFKDKADNLSVVSAGLFTYPVLMAADILLYDAHRVPVGKDQKQHLEMARDIAASLNHQLGAEVLVLPEPEIDERVMTVPGTDGRKMSKSYGNTLPIFAPEKELKKAVMGIMTDSTPLEAPKNPDTDNVYALFSLVATPEETAEMRQKYLAGGFGYGQAKQWLLQVLLQRYAEPRRVYTELQANPAEVERLLLQGCEKARAAGSQTLQRVRRHLGLRVS